jgi:hypothetical protein
MTEEPQVEALGGHQYLVRARQDEDIVEFEVYATPNVVARLISDRTDETRIIEATVAYLIARQRPDDLPPQLDLDDVRAAYEGFEDALRHQLADGGSQAANTKPMEPAPAGLAENLEGQCGWRG